MFTSIMLYSRNVLPERAEEIMAYAVKNDYPDTMSIAAPLILDKPLEDALVRLPLKIALAWVYCSFYQFDH